MKEAFGLILTNVPSLGFLGAGVFLLMHGHPVAGGFCLLLSAITAHSFKDK